MPVLRTCKICNKNKDEKLMALGRVSNVTKKRLFRNICKECWPSYTREAQIRYRKTDKGRINDRNSVKKYKSKPENLIKLKAHSKIHNLTGYHKQKREPCVECGDSKTMAHHHDYNKPLDVVWLCRKHHIDAHKKLLKNKK